MIQINLRNFLLKFYRHLKFIFLLQTFLDPASGASDDWAKSIGIKYAYTIELSPSDISQNNEGFVLNESQISRVCSEMLPALDVLINTTLSEFLGQSVPLSSTLYLYFLFNLYGYH